MGTVNQAIVASLDTDGHRRYQVVARSSGVCPDDECELAVWGPSSDALSRDGPDAESLNFHPLPSGAYCISRSIAAGRHRDGSRRLFTHCLIVPRDVLERFANNPFAVADVMSRYGLWRRPEAGIRGIEPLSLPDGASPVDLALLQRLAIEPGPQLLAALVQSARDAVCLAVSGPDPAGWIAGLLNCLPVECRLEFSFATGLKFSPERPFRLVTLSDDPAEYAWVSNYPNVTVFDSAPTSTRSMPVDGWARLIERVLDAGQISFFAAQLSKPRADLVLEDLSALGLQLLENLDWVQCSGDGDLQSASLLPAAGLGAPATLPRAHAPHRQFEKIAMSSQGKMERHAAIEHGHQSPEILEKLERLDDMVYEAISGPPDALDALREEWPRTMHDLGGDTLAESREQYLRYALSIWEQCAQADHIRDPGRAVQALDVLSILFGDGL